ncbi:hypothetical protein [Pseudomonas sp. LRF_L74]|uniref:hypothetical protein n=1 Tax=Pseudomonas sp. LRF_L74 TaxID=3369422 RepID=UPI003F5E9757
MNQQHGLLLARLVERWPGAGVDVRETSLALSEDGDSLLLRRYWEHYSAGDRAICLERCHRIPVERLVRWMICQGEASDRL